nr:proteinaceous RNase P 2-like [Tanacetum cinerariifolium]
WWLGWSITNSHGNQLGGDEELADRRTDIEQSGTVKQKGNRFSISCKAYGLLVSRVVCKCSFETTEMASTLNMSKFSNKDNLLGPETKPADAVSRTPGLDNSRIVGLQRQIMTGTVISMCRLAAADNDGDYAFELVKNLERYGDKARLRTYDPALFCFVEKREAEKAYLVEEEILRNGLCLDESEINALLKELVCVDIGKDETEKFAQSVVGLAVEREKRSNFTQFQDWLDQHNEFEAIVDGANIGLYQQNFAEGGFSVSQLEVVVNELYKRSNKWPLVILHDKRIRGLLANPANRGLLQGWIDNGILYGTPVGSNDDWYWLYASVKLKCMLVTNDQMRDHIFELLGSSFFPMWKERHQVHYTFPKGHLKLQMPPSYSLVIQESERGAWHVPVAGEYNEAVDNGKLTNGNTITGKRKESSRTPVHKFNLIDEPTYDEFDNDNFFDDEAAVDETVHDEYTHDKTVVEDTTEVFSHTLYNKVLETVRIDERRTQHYLYKLHTNNDQARRFQTSSLSRRKIFHVQQLEKIKDINALPSLYAILNNEGFDNVKLSYLKGYWVIINTYSIASNEKLIKHIGVLSWFSELGNANNSFVSDVRLVWIFIEGLPIYVWNKDVLAKIVTPWGTLSDVDAVDDASFPF